MAVQSTLPKFPSAQTVVDNTLLSPFITGPLLLYTRRNPSVLEKIPWFPDLTLTLPFHLPFNLSNSVTIRPSPPAKTLKVLFSLGLILYANRFLNRLALNYWHLHKQGVPWDFQTEGRETILITGGCSGFGKEMVKKFAAQTKANIVVLDIQDLPAEMKNSKYSPIGYLYSSSTGTMWPLIALGLTQHICVHCMGRLVVCYSKDESLENIQAYLHMPLTSLFVSTPLPSIFCDFLGDFLNDPSYFNQTHLC